MVLLVVGAAALALFNTRPLAGGNIARRTPGLSSLSGTVDAAGVGGGIQCVGQG